MSAIYLLLHQKIWKWYFLPMPSDAGSWFHYAVHSLSHRIHVAKHCTLYSTCTVYVYCTVQCTVCLLLYKNLYTHTIFCHHMLFPFHSNYIVHFIMHCMSFCMPPTKTCPSLQYACHLLCMPFIMICNYMPPATLQSTCQVLCIAATPHSSCTACPLLYISATLQSTVQSTCQLLYKPATLHASFSTCQLLYMPATLHLSYSRCQLIYMPATLYISYSRCRLIYMPAALQPATLYLSYSTVYMPATLQASYSACQLLCMPATLHASYFTCRLLYISATLHAGYSKCQSFLSFLPLGWRTENCQFKLSRIR